MKAYIALWTIMAILLGSLAWFAFTDAERALAACERHERALRVEAGAIGQCASMEGCVVTSDTLVDFAGRANLHARSCGGKL